MPFAMRLLAPLCASLLLVSSPVLAETEPPVEDDEAPAPEPPKALPPTPFLPPPPVDYSHPEPPRSKWYGWQNLTADGAALTIFILAAGQRDGEALLWSGLATYALAGPIIHFAHENVGGGFASLGLRVGAPLGGMLLGCAADDSKGMFGCIGGAALGFIVGYTAAVAIDASVLAYEPESSARTSKARPLIVPTAAWSPHGGTLGLQGIF